MARLLSIARCVGIPKRGAALKQVCRFLEEDVEGTPTREEYNVQYAEYRKDMRAFRKRVVEAIAEKKEEEARRRAEESEKTSTEEGRDPEAQRHRDERRAELKKKIEELVEAKRERKKQSFEREALRRKLLREAEDERYAALLQQSRLWITEDTLDDRIQRALDNAVNLY